jgi:hypothetical protein
LYHSHHDLVRFAKNSATPIVATICDGSIFTASEALPLAAAAVGDERARAGKSAEDGGHICKLCPRIAPTTHADQDKKCVDAARHPAGKRGTVVLR